MNGLTTFGFKWGPMEVTRIIETPREYVLAVETERNAVKIYVSPKGRSVRVFRNGRELCTAVADEGKAGNDE